MENVNPFLVDWAIRYIENKDIVKKKIINIEKNQEGFDFIVHYKDKVKYFIIMPTLANDIFSILKNPKGIFGTPKIAKRFSSEIKNDGAFGIFTLNNPQNIRLVVSEWKKLTNFRFLNVYFVNPFSSSDKVWAINPYIHEVVCDKSSLESGLKAMAEMVEPLGVEELNNKVKLIGEESDL